MSEESGELSPRGLAQADGHARPGNAPATAPWATDLTLTEGEVIPAAELARLEILRGVAPESVSGALERCTLRTLAADETLLEAGQVESTLYLILSGRLATLGADGDAESFLEAGRAVGEMAVLDRGASPATLQAHVQTRLLVVDEESFWALTWSSHDFAVNVLAQLPRRVGGSGIAHRDGGRQRAGRDRETLTDALTGCHNRRWLDQTLPRFIKRHAVARTPLSLLFIDLDHFRRFNEKNGHLAGDCALASVARSIVEGLRPTDHVARHGGEEFLVLLPGAPLEGARLVAGRLRARIGKTIIVGPDGGAVPSVTVSIAVVAVGADEPAARVLTRTGELLYRAKLAGRNRVEG